MALKYILPNFYDSYFCNLTISQKLLQTKNISGVYGTFPFSIFNGSYNNIAHEHICMYDDMKKIVTDYGMLADMIILDYGNSLIETFDFKDLYNQVILEEFAHKSNFYFAVTKIDFIEYLVEKYPTINIILHQNYTRSHPSENIQEIVDKYQNIKGIITSSFNLCSKVTNVFKIYLTPIHGCEECIQYEKCLYHDNISTLEFSEKSQFAECSLRKYIHPESVVNRLNYIKQYCDYIMFDTVVSQYQEEEYIYIEEILSNMEE